MPQSIVNQPTPSQVSGRLATWHRVMEEAGLEYADLQKPIDDPQFRALLVNYWRGGAILEEPASTPVPAALAAPLQPQFAPVPAVNEPFDLEIDGDLDITPAGWKALGPAFPTGTRIHRCRLLDLGYCSNRDDAIRKIGEQAKELKVKLVAALGPAREAFLAKYPRHNGRPIVMAGQEWRGGNRRRRVPFLDRWGDSRFGPSFFWSVGVFGDVCLWLVVEQDA